MMFSAARRPWCAAAGDFYYDAFSQDFFIGHFPWNTFNPGPAYNGIGPSAITSGSAALTIPEDGSPIFTGFAPITDVWTVDQNICALLTFRTSISTCSRNWAATPRCKWPTWDRKAESCSASAI